MTFPTQAISEDCQVLCKTESPQYSLETLAIVDKIWQEASNEKAGQLFNGKIFSVDSYTSSLITGHITDYKFFLAQQRQPELFTTLNIQPLAVDGILTSGEGDLVFGRRARHLTQEAHRWELAPAGGIDCSRINPGEAVNYLQQLFTELEEEIGIHQSQVNHAKPFLLLLVPNTHVLNIYIKATINMSNKEIQNIFHQNNAREYDKLHTVPPTQAFEFCQNNNVIEASKHLLTLLNDPTPTSTVD